MYIRTVETIVNKINLVIREASLNSRKVASIVLTQPEFAELKEWGNQYLTHPRCDAYTAKPSKDTKVHTETFDVLPQFVLSVGGDKLTVITDVYYQGIPVFVCPRGCKMPG